MDAFIFSANAVLPIILMVSIGWFSHKVGLIDDDFIKKGNKFNFRIGFFALIFISMYSIEEINSVHRNLILFSFCSILCVIGLGFLIAAIFVKAPRQKGVMVQAVYRSNFAIIGVPLANMLFGEKGGSCAAIIIAVSIPLYNIFGVLALTIFIKENRAEKKFLENAKEISLKLIKNPMLQGIFFGGICLALRPHLNG